MIDFSGTITASQLVSELGVAAQTAANILKEVGGGQKVGNVTFYDRDAVKRHVAGKNTKVLEFLGYAVSPKEEDDAEQLAFPVFGE